MALNISRIQIPLVILELAMAANAVPPFHDI